MECSELRGWIRLEKLVWTDTGSAKNGPTRTQQGPKNQKTDQKPGKPDAGIALQGQITLVYVRVFSAKSN